MQFRKKPVVIEAMQFTEETKNQVFNWIGRNRYADWDERGNSALIIQTLEGDLTATLGDWIIKGVKGEFYPCKPDIFEMTYDAVNEAVSERGTFRVSKSCEKHPGWSLVNVSTAPDGMDSAEVWKCPRCLQEENERLISSVAP